jgi:hypothetical protein
VTAAAAVAALALTATPARVQLDGARAATVQVTNRGGQPVVLDVARAGFALDLRGRPRIAPAAPPGWLSFQPRRVAIPPGASAALRLAGHVPPGAAPGDHPGLLVLASRPLARGTVAVRVRLGIVVLLRVPGKVVHRLALTTLKARKRVLALGLANRGNVAETLLGRSVTVTLWRRGQLVARLHPLSRELLPRARAVLELRYRGRIHGPVVARAELGPVRRTFHLRL